MNALTGLIALPLFAAGVAYVLNSNRAARMLLVFGGVGHFVLSVLCVSLGLGRDGVWLALDPPGAFFLLITSVLFLAVSAHTAIWLDRDRRLSLSPFDAAHKGSGRMPERLFVPCMLGFLAMMSMVICSRNFGLLWVAMEATTLVSAPLLCFHRSDRSLEAMWKYLLVCSVGIGLALFGCMLLATSAKFIQGAEVGLGFDELFDAAPNLHHGWLKMAFVFMLAGFGAKMGLAPFHTWLPDAHSEAPAPISALLSGSLLNCAFLGVLRIRQVCVGAGIADFCSPFLIALGLLSLLVAAAFIVGQLDYKRLLAYSSVEHIGVATLGIGLGGDAVFGSLYHLLNHSLTKGMLFMLAGNLLLRYGTRAIGEVRGAIRAAPWTAVLLLAGLLAITATPPFGLFISEFTILSVAIKSGHFLVAGLYLLLLAVAFAGMSFAFVKMLFGEPSPSVSSQGQAETALRSESPSLLAAPLLLGLATLVLGVWLPGPLAQIVNSAIDALG